MTDTHWFKIEASKEKEGPYNYIGSSTATIEEIADRVKAGEFIRLDNLLYADRGEFKEWASWDKTLVPSVLIHPRIILSIMEFKGDPRTLPKT
jgi:hypothetical protein